MIRIAIDPTIFYLGPLAVGWHGLFTALAVVLAVLLTARLAKRAGISDDDVYATAIWAVPGGIVGARLFHVIDKIDYYIDNPLSVFALTEGGLSLYGALLGGTVVGVAYAWHKRLPIARLADHTAPGMLVAQIVGRIGCVINGDAYGSPTTLPWGLVYTNEGAFVPRDWILDGVASHPAPVYEILWDLFVLALVWRLLGRLRPDGTTFVLYLMIYSVGRFFISFVRMDPVIAWGLQQAQIVSLLVLGIGALILIYLDRSRGIRIRVRR